MYGKKEIVDGVIKFINNDLMLDIDDKHLKFVLSMAKKALRENPDLVDIFFKSPIVINVIKEYDGEYDLEVFAKMLKNILNEYGSYSITIPKIPMFSPEEKRILLTSEDVDKVLSYLVPIENTVAQ